MLVELLRLLLQGSRVLMCQLGRPRYDVCVFLDDFASSQGLLLQVPCEREHLVAELLLNVGIIFLHVLGAVVRPALPETRRLVAVEKLFPQFLVELCVVQLLDFLQYSVVHIRRFDLRLQVSFWWLHVVDRRFDFPNPLVVARNVLSVHCLTGMLGS